jgi:beta-N-acetylhexosaminidase
MRLSARSLPVGAMLMAVGAMLVNPGTGSVDSEPRAPVVDAAAPAVPAPRLTKAQQCVQRVLDRSTLRVRAGQLVMVGIAADSSRLAPAAAQALQDSGIGNVILTGRSARGVDATATLVRRIRAILRRGPAGRIRPEVAADQEGGQVQVLSGPGFSDLPTARHQGTWATPHLSRAARRWGEELADAGVTLNLSPVLDVVPEGRPNEPIGRYDRHFGPTPRQVTIKGSAFVRGSQRAGTAVTVKHFPGLGRATGNTDVTADVVDRVTTRRDRMLRPFSAAIRRGAAYVMMSSARYPRLDPDRLAAFSPVIVRGMLRRQLGFDGVVISDDVGIATAVQHIAAGRRATAFVRAGGDMVLSVDAPAAVAMVDALVSLARRSTTFRARIDRAAERVLLRKAAAGLVCR